jgi:hypothetical protein
MDLRIAHRTSWCPLGVTRRTSHSEKGRLGGGRLAAPNPTARRIVKLESSLARRLNDILMTTICLGAHNLSVA